MSQLTRQISRVRRRLTAGEFVHALAWSAVAVGIAACLGIAAARLLQYALPAPQWAWLAGGAVAATIAAGGWALLHRPDAATAAEAIDRVLDTRDRFATALYFQSSTDDFAGAARADAEQTAQHTSLRRKFPVRFPRAGYAALAVAAVAVLLYWALPSMDLLGRQAHVRQQASQKQQAQAARQAVKEALARVQAVPKAAADSQVLKKAQSDLTQLLQQPQVDPAAAHRKVLEALQNVDQSMQQKIRSSAQFAQLQQQKEMMKGLEGDAKGDNENLKAARQALKKGDFAQAARDMQSAAEQFQKMTPQQQQQMARQMQEMAQQLQQAAGDPNQMQQMRQQLQQMGATAQQAQQMTRLLQQAAQGDAAAQQQLQQMAKHISQQAGPEAQKMQQQLQQAVQQMQGKMAASQQAQQLAQAANQLAQAMGQNSNQRLASAGESMQQQLGNLAALQNDLAHMQAMQQAMQQAAGQQQAMLNGQPAMPPPTNSSGGSKAGHGHVVPPLADDSIKPVYKTVAEQAPSNPNAKSPPLAAYFINAPSVKGESHIKMSELKEATAQEAAQSVDLQHVPPPVREAVKEYFDFSNPAP